LVNSHILFFQLCALDISFFNFLIPLYKAAWNKSALVNTAKLMFAGDNNQRPLVGLLAL
jgi:hypothetical protein